MKDYQKIQTGLNHSIFTRSQKLRYPLVLIRDMINESLEKVYIKKSAPKVILAHQKALTSPENKKIKRTILLNK